MHSIILFLQRFLSSPRFWFVAVVGFTLLYYFAEHEGFYYADDGSYSLYAHQVLHGGFHFDDYSFCHRFMVFVPTTLFYWLWDHNIYTTTLWPLLCTLGTLLLLYLTFRKKHPVAISWALVLLGLYYFQLNTSNYLYPDNILLFFTTACLLVLYRARNPLPSVKEEVYWGMGFAVLNLLAFLTKETIVYTVPFYLTLFGYQAFRRQNSRFWFTAAVTGILLLAAYFLLYKIYSGDALQRLYDIKATNTAETKQAYLDTRSATLFPRLTYGPFLFFIGTGLAIPLAMAALFWMSNSKKQPFSLSSPIYFWLIAMLGMLLPIWFGTATVDFYKPMPLVPRMFHPLLPAFCLLAGLTMEQVWNKRIAFLYLAVVFGISTLLVSQNMVVMYLPLTLFFAVLFFWNRSWPHWLGLLAVAAVLCIRPVYFMIKPTVSYYFEQKALVDQHLNHENGRHVVLMDSFLLEKFDFFYGFQVPKNYTFQEYSAYLKSAHPATDSVFLLINNGVLEHPELMLTLREKDILPLFPSAQLINQKGKVKLFMLPKDSLK
ncbi:glycosyltransferase family 39 protein [Rufibacter tibetensis]|uniref:glycosyltransferase family 39 protein n=1 Tax=Rufibacter tibetensis TaxID=512763 RepID=UPI0014703D08|nr:glycosyltransferase family 39 protein [Rufibacter tibetensis]